MTEPPLRQQEGSRPLRFVLAWAAVSSVVLAGCAIFLFLHGRTNQLKTVPELPANSITEKIAEPETFASSDSVTVSLGEGESGHGLMLSHNVGDGRTTIESVDGVPARVQRLTNNRTTVNFYFRIDPTFKQQDVTRARIDVEYLDPFVGTMGIHYDALDGQNGSNPSYREANEPVQMAGSKAWQKATFRTRGDASFSNRQNGQSDFRLWAKTPLLYVRRVTVTREAGLDDGNWTIQFSASNQVEVLLGQENPEREGLRHLADQNDGRTTIETLDGVPCRYLNRLREGRMFGSFYFAISPSFKRDGLKNARVDIEYFSKPDHAFRLQFDGMDGDTHQRYLPLLPEGARVMRFGTGADYGTAPTVGAWAVATFHITNAFFMNSQKGGADFRLEVVPPELHVRRVSVTREGAQPSRPSPIP
jgi:hypothetical protein